MDKQLYRVEEVAEICSLSRTKIYEEIRAGRIESVSIGVARRVTAHAIDRYVELLRSEQQG